MYDQKEIDAFLKDLYHYRPRWWKFQKNHWQIMASDIITRWNKSETRSYCPITYLAKEKLGEDFSMSSFRLAGQALGLSHDTISAIVDAADYNIGNEQYHPELREQILKITRAKEAKYK